ncbi:Beta-galactosidase C-terminal domain, partial [Streptomyces acidiscabies]
YVSTRLGAEGLDTVLARAADDAGITPRDLPRDVEVVRRSGENADYLFAINHTAGDVKVPLESAGTELLTGDPASGHLAVPAGAVRVVRLDG